ncbi:MAG TPA: hypothetical protein VGV61_13245 [Thermoanaerobaculia bacterium]|jgi:hypothetical protein|nr:hypothetical protein [Thermoanaerobaculia bacterium]
MPPLRVTCQQCQRVTVVDSDKVPDQPVSYKCPGCGSKVVIDKKKLLSGGVPDAPGTGTAEPGAAAGRGAGAAEPPAGIDPMLELALPPGEGIPPGIVVSEDRAAASLVQRLLEPFDCTLEPFTDSALARERIMQEPPLLLLYVAETVSKPPFAPLEPLLSLPPRERRQVFIALIADNVKTLDGNLAFLYQVNLLLNKQHLAQAPGILYAALRYQQRLYRPFLAAMGE